MISKDWVVEEDEYGNAHGMSICILSSFWEDMVIGKPVKWTEKSNAMHNVLQVNEWI